jgi:ubiquinone/menaquinone biosynthesis C-methylase UbiE
MSLHLRRHADLSSAQLASLEQSMTSFYQNPPPSYYQIADKSPAQYTPDQQPFHCDLISRVSSGDRVLEAGCGTAHLCPLVEQQGGNYTGLDHSEDLLNDNRRKFPQARFFSVKSPPAETYDLVVSMYTIEHVTNPPAYLESLWRYCRPGGLIAIICPEFIDSPGFAPSIFFGQTPGRFKEKLKKLALFDASTHWLDFKIFAPRWKRRAQADAPGAFWINLNPRILRDHHYGIDTDAVHLVQLRDLVWFFQSKGADILQSSKRMLNIPAPLENYNCYLVAEKTGAKSTIKT